MGFHFSASYRALIGVAPGLCLFAAATNAQAGVPRPTVVPAEIVLQTGDTPTDGAPVAAILQPWVNDDGQVAFVGFFEGGEHYVWIDDDVAWVASDDREIALTNAESYMDSNSAGNWVYAQDADGLDSLYTDAGLFAAQGDDAPGIADFRYAFLSAPQMASDGEIYWLAFIEESGGAPEGIALYRAPDGTHDSAEVVLQSGDMIDDDVIDNIDFSYNISEDGMHSIFVVSVEGDPTINQYIMVDEAAILREGDSTGGDDTWDFFDLSTVNDSGNYMFSALTTGPGETSTVITYNSEIVVREGDTVAGVELASPADQVRFLALNDVEQAAFGWLHATGGGFAESVFFACNTDDVPGSAISVLTTNQTGIDIDDDDELDFTITDLINSDPYDSIAIGNDPVVYVSATLQDTKGAFSQAMLRLPVECCGNGSVDGNEECDDANDDDTDDCLPGCIAASCGDGVVYEDEEGCDDGNDDDTDDCPTNCEPASCGDGFVQDGVEECDDGNDDDADDCRNDCTMGAGPSESSGDETSDTNDGTGDTTGPPATATITAVTSGASATAGDTDTDGDDGGAADDLDGCGCRGGGSGTPALGLLALGLLAIRPRRRRS